MDHTPPEPCSLGEIAQLKNLPIEFLHRLGVHDDQGRIGIDYLGQSGSPLFTRHRPGREGRKFDQPFGVKLAPYGLQKIEEAHARHSLILVEGESDCWALWYHGYPALGIPGSNAYKCVTFDLVDGLEAIWIHREPDAGGENFARGCAAHLRALGFSGLIKIFSSPAGVKDPSELHVRAATADAFKAAFEAAIAAGTFVDREPIAQAPAPTLPILTPEQAAAPGPVAAPKRRLALLEEYQPFPTHALPPPLDEFVRQSAIAIGCDHAYLALPLLAIAGSAIGNSRVVQLKIGWTEPSVVWSVVVGDSGTLKSPALRAVTQHLHRLQARFRSEFKQRHAAYEEQYADYEYAKKEARYAKSQLAMEQPDKPVFQRIMCSDVTIERLGQILEENPRGVLLYRDELATWLGSFTRYKKASDQAEWLPFFNADPISVDRSKDGGVHVAVGHCHVCVAGGIQPGTLRDLATPEAIAAGLFARLLMAQPPKRAKVWTDLFVHPELEQSYCDVIDRLYALEGELKFGAREPKRLEFAPRVHEQWKKFFHELSKRQLSAYGEVAAALSKLEAYTARFALIHHIVKHVFEGTPDTVPIEMESLHAGIQLTEWFEREAFRIYAMLKADPTSTEIRRVHEYIQAQGGRMSMSKMRHHLRFETMAGLETVVQPLIDMKRAMIVEERPPNGGRLTRYVQLLEPTASPREDEDE